MDDNNTMVKFLETRSDMKGKAKLVRKGDGKYYVYVRNFWFQRWKPLFPHFSDKQLSFNTFKEFGEIAKIESFDIITVSYDKFSGLER